MSRNLGSAVLTGKTKTFATNFTDLHGLKQKKISENSRNLRQRTGLFSFVPRETGESKLENLRGLRLSPALRQAQRGASVAVKKI
jgi:hypothetical protein